MKQLPQKLPDSPNNRRQQRDEIDRVAKRSPKFPLKQLIYVALGIGVVLLIVAVLRPAPILVDTGTVQRGELQVTVDAEGKTRVRDRFTVAADTDGHLERILLDEGDTVRAGEIVARIDPLPLNASVEEALGRLAEWKAERAGVATQRPKPETLEQARNRIHAAQAKQRLAEARVVQARADLEQAKRDRERAQYLEARGAIPRKDRELAQLNEITKAKQLEADILAANTEASEVKVAQAALAVLQKEQTDPDYLLKVYDARIASTEAELSKLRDEAARTDIHSPVSGQVLRIHQKSAQFVADGTPLLEIGNPKQLELVIDVLSADAMKIKPGDAIAIDLGSEAKPLRAKVRRIEPSAFMKVSALGVEEQRVNIIGDFVDSSASFGDAYRVEVRIVVWEGKNVLKAPLSALFRCQQSDWCAFVVENGRAIRRQVAIAHRNDLEAEIEQGLKEGELVILHPTEQIDEGSRLTFR
jgi:HlyD family secretion protein